MRRASRARAPRLRGGGPRRRGRWRARPAPRGRPWPRPSAATASCMRSRASNSRRWADVSCSSAARCSISMRCDRLARFVFALLLRAQLFFGGAPLVGDLILLAGDALGRLVRRCRPGARSRPSPSPARCCSAWSARIADSVGRDRHVERGRRPRAAARASRRLGLGALAQLLDLALGRQDAARFGARAPFDPRPARGRPRRAAWRPGPFRIGRGLACRLVVVGDPRVRDGRADRVARPVR